MGTSDPISELLVKASSQPLSYVKDLATGIQISYEEAELQKDHRRCENLRLIRTTIDNIGYLRFGHDVWFVNSPFRGESRGRSI